MTEYSTLAIICGLKDIAGWLENEGGRDKHARQIRAAFKRMAQLAEAAHDGTSDEREIGLILTIHDDEILAGVSEEKIAQLRAEVAQAIETRRAADKTERGDE